MTWKKLIKNGSLQKKKVSSIEVDRILIKSQEAIKAAEILIEQDLKEPSFEQAYKSMLLTGRALIFSVGLRPRSVGSHIITVNFCKLFLGKNNILLMNKFEKARRKRNHLIYGASITISRTEVGNLIKAAKDFVKKVEKLIEKRNSQDKLL